MPAHVKRVGHVGPLGSCVCPRSPLRASHMHAREIFYKTNKAHVSRLPWSPLPLSIDTAFVQSVDSVGRVEALLAARCVRTGRARVHQ